jgi:methionine-rich copper-binding protein CopC
VTRRAARAAAAAALGSALLLSGAPAAAAHDELTATSPADGATVAAPTQVSLTFSEAVLRVGDRVVVTGPDGDATDGALAVDGAVLTQPLRAGLPAGTYTVTWRAASDDGHPVSGRFTFTVRAGGAAAPAPTGTASAAPSPAAAAPAVDHTARDVGIGAFAVLVVALVLAVRRRR